ncbi:DUF2971 domain-containing protein [Fluoribacter dumoffii]|uniref:Protein of uncharacterized function (DUF2971) n=1 Tax=Fluoribacter dumoffii TaxID=463 RepID=A0A377IW11_9GAMM|nr:DUF2971 domain-containing protein [Fluoribacter dumoffii]STO91735.1 Protein of uncharacterised function (DUF2971) [Fluoribacter dumoffii]
MESCTIKLYKYSSNFSYIKDYCANQVWTHPICELNDPFEAKVVSHHPEPSVILSDPKLYEHYFKGMGQGEGSLSEIEFKKTLESPKFAEQVKKSKFGDHPFLNYGVLSLTTDPQNILMWTYYANNHEGYCIEFELDFVKIQEISGLSDFSVKKYMQNFIEGKEILSLYTHNNEFALFGVNYSEELPLIKIEDLLKLPESYERTKLILRNTVGTKFKDWAHEKEFRIVTKLNSNESGLLNLSRFVPFLRFKGIILGSRTKPQNKAIVTKLFNKDTFKYYRANLVEGKYALSITKYK